MNHELTLAFPLAVHEQQDVALSKTQDFLAEARRRMTIAAMVAGGDVCTHGVESLISDAIELTRAADAKSAGAKIILGSGDVSIERLKDLAQAILCATSEMATLDEVELDAVTDLLMALTNGLERHAKREAADGKAFLAEIASERRPKQPKGAKRTKRAA